MPHPISIELRAINVRSKIPIFSALDFIGVSLTHGPSTQQILCPFHDDSKPSARVYSDTNKVFCFTCHKLWDPITLVMDSKNVGFTVAISLLEEHFNLPSPSKDLVLIVQQNVRKRENSLPGLSYLSSYVEERLVASKKELGLEKFSRLLTALDAMNYYLSLKRVSESNYRDTLRQILSKIPQDV